MQRLEVRSTYPIVAFWVFAISTIILTGISLLSAALYYWNITAYLLLFPLLPEFFREEESGVRLSRASADGSQEAEGETQNSLAQRHGVLLKTQNSPHFLAHKPVFFAAQFYGLLFAMLLVVHYSFFPLSALFDKETDPDSRMLFGWDQVAAVVRMQSEAVGRDRFLATTDYRSASALAYQLNDKNVMAISDRIDQFDFWYTSDRAFKGRNAILLSDDWHPMQPELLAQFERTSERTTVAIVRFGVWIKNYYIVRGYDFKGGRVS